MPREQAALNAGGPGISRIAGASPSRASVVPGVDTKYPLAQSVANGPRFLPNIREGWLRSVDANLQKSVFLTERIRLSLQLRAFNVLNQVSFAGPSIITVGQGNFGSAGGIVNNARRGNAPTAGAAIFSNSIPISPDRAGKNAFAFPA